VVTEPQQAPKADVSIDKVWGDAWAVYKLLFRRSVVTAALVYAVIDLISLLGHRADSSGARFGLGLAGFVLGLAGPVLVQGALIEIVRNVHAGELPVSIGRLLQGAARKIRPLLWASIVYGLGVVLGLIALIVPGLLAASRWCLMAPLIMLEGETARDARYESRVRVTPYTWSVLGVVVATFVTTALITAGIPSVVAHRHVGAVGAYLVTVAASALTAPFYAHVLTVIYYRITEPDRPVIHPDVLGWRSVWKGA
jgi:hypothetical protein